MIDWWLPIGRQATNDQTGTNSSFAQTNVNHEILTTPIQIQENRNEIWNIDKAWLSIVKIMVEPLPDLCLTQRNFSGDRRQMLAPAPQYLLFSGLSSTLPIFAVIVQKFEIQPSVSGEVRIP